jgi:hypothetical protein
MSISFSSSLPSTFFLWKSTHEPSKAASAHPKLKKQNSLVALASPGGHASITHAMVHGFEDDKPKDNNGDDTL